MYSQPKHANGQLYGFVLWLLSALFFFAEYLARVAPSVMEKQLMQAFQINAMEFGLLSSFFYYTYTSMQLPVGGIVDRFAPQRCLACMALLSAIGCYLFAHTHSFAIAAFARSLTGFCGAFAFIGSLKIATQWFDHRYIGLLTGSTQALGMLGAAIGESSMAKTVDQIGWQSTMGYTTYGLMIIGLLMLCFNRQAPRQNQEKKIKIKQALFEVLKSRKNWINALFAGLIYAPTGAFSELWGPTYLQAVYHYTAHQAASVNMTVFLGWAIGGPMIGKWSDHIGKRLPFLRYGSLLGLVLLSILLYWPHLTISMAYILAFCYGLSNTALVCAYTIAGQQNRREIAGTSLALANMASVIIGAAFMPLIGYLLDIFWNGNIVDGTRHYSTSAYQIAMILLPLCLICAYLCTRYIEEPRRTC